MIDITKQSCESCNDKIAEWFITIGDKKIGLCEGCLLELESKVSEIAPRIKRYYKL